MEKVIMWIILLHIDKYLDKSQIENHIHSWPEKVKSHILSFQQSKDYNSSFWGKILLLFAFQQNQKVWNWDLLEWTDKDKPFLIDHSLFFNISHSGEYVLLGIDQKNIGVDIEMHRPVRLELFNRQFHPDEWSQIRQAKDPLEKFFQFWSIKEAAIKADGRGVEVLSKTVIDSDKIIKIEDQTCYYQYFDILDGYSMAVTSPSSFYFNYKEIQSIRASVLLEEM